jgi:ATP-dependent Clp protease ATP-binding subunit ClpC
MFERYTEHARRVIFHARYTASQSGSPMMETEHLLLGLLYEASPLIPRLAPNVSVGRLFNKIPKKTNAGERVSPPLTLPLSTECKRILSYAIEEANDLNHSVVGAEHLLLGIVREEKCLAARLLVEAGIQLEVLRNSLTEECARHPGSDGSEWGAAEVGRETIHALIDELPDRMLACAKIALDHMLSSTRADKSQPEVDSAARQQPVPPTKESAEGVAAVGEDKL